MAPFVWYERRLGGVFRHGRHRRHSLISFQLPPLRNGITPGVRLMAGYIRWDKELRDDPRVIELADAYADLLARQFAQLCPGVIDPDLFRNALRAVTRNATLGALTKLWGYADDHIADDNGLHVTLEYLAEQCNVPLDWFQHFPPKWLDLTGPRNAVLPEYREKNSLLSRDVRRAQNRERVRRFRERQAIEASNKKTPAAGSISRNACNADVMHPPRGRGRAGASSASSSVSKTPQPPATGGRVNGHAPDREPDRIRRGRSLDAWRMAALVVDEIRSSPGATWTDAQQRVGPLAHEATERVGGYRVIAERTKFTVKDLRERFRTAYERAFEKSNTPEGRMTP